jgi:hypothetical protein
MKNTIKLSMKFSALALVSVLTACGGGGGGSTPAPAPTAVLAPGIWNKTDNSTSTTKFIGVVTTAGSGGDVWGWTYNTAAGTSKMFTGAVAASGENFVTSQGTELSYSSAGWAAATTGKSLTLPKSATSGQQVFDFGTTYTTALDTLWNTTAQFNSVTDWNTTWTLAEIIPNPVDSNTTLTVSYAWEVSSKGELSGTKTVQGQSPCYIKPIVSAVTAREKAVVNVNVTYVCGSDETAYSGISFPLEATPQGTVTKRAVWMKRTGTNEFVTQVFVRPS